MRDLSLHLLDIMQNSIAAKADRIKVDLQTSGDDGTLCITIEDNGVGMDEELLKKVTSPFVTTRKTRKVGMGIPLLKAAAQLTTGDLEIVSEVGKGTTLKVTFGINHIDRPPLGSVADTMVSMVMANPEVDFELLLDNGNESFEFNTRDIKDKLGDVPISQFDVLDWMREYIDGGLKEIFGGVFNEIVG